MPTTHLLIFCKYPAAGEVMTRLCPPLTHDEAATVQRACIRLLCERAFRVWDVRPRLVISPDDAEESFREFVGPYIPILTQGDGEIGQRFARAVAVASSDGAEKIIIIGSDSPTLTAEHINAAASELDKADAVLGPCDDGRHYLLGVKRPCDEWLTRVDWSGDRVVAQAKKAAGRGMTLHLLQPWYGIDTIAGLERALADIRAVNACDDYELRRVIEMTLEAAGKRKSKVRS